MLWISQLPKQDQALLEIGTRRAVVAEETGNAAGSFQGIRSCIQRGASASLEERFQPLPSLLGVTGPHPETPHLCGQTQTCLGVLPFLQAPPEGRPHVTLLGCYLRKPLFLLR